MFQSVMTSYPNPPMLEAAVPSPNTLPVEEVMALLKAGVWPNDAVEPNAGGLPKPGGLPKTGALPKPPVEKQQLSVLNVFTTATVLLRTQCNCGLILGSCRPNTLSFKDKMNFIKSARLSGGTHQITLTFEPTLSTSLTSLRGWEEKVH